MTDYRLVAFDIDGTLLGTSRTPQPGTLAAFDAMRAAGTRIMLASGRPISGLKMLARTHGLGEDLVFAGMNGSIVHDQATDTEITRYPMDRAVAERAIELGHEHGIMMMVPIGAHLFVEDDSHERVAREAEGNAMTVTVIEDLTRLEQDPTKILFVAEPEDMGPLLEQLEGELGEKVELAWSSPIYLEATAVGVDKGQAIRDFCAANDIDLASVIAFGDNGNDVGMLSTVGLGVAMGNAIDAAKEAAAEVTDTNDNEGIAKVLSRYFNVEVS